MPPAKRRAPRPIDRHAGPERSKAGARRSREASPQISASQGSGPAPKSWRDVLPVHSAAELFPSMSPDEQRALGEDIVKNGLTSPVVLWSDGKSPERLLDGRNRLDGIEIATGSEAIIGAPSIIAGEDFSPATR